MPEKITVYKHTEMLKLCQYKTCDMQVPIKH